MKKYDKIKRLLEKLQKEIDDLNEPIQIGLATDNHKELEETVWNLTFYNIHIDHIGELRGKLR